MELLPESFTPDELDEELLPELSIELLPEPDTPLLDELLPELFWDAEPPAPPVALDADPEVELELPPSPPAPPWPPLADEELLPPVLFDVLELPLVFELPFEFELPLVLPLVFELPFELVLPLVFELPLVLVFVLPLVFVDGGAVGGGLLGGGLLGGGVVLWPQSFVCLCVFDVVC